MLCNIDYTMMKDFYSISEVADMLTISKETLRRWDKSGKLKAVRHPINNYRVYPTKSLQVFEKLGFLFNAKTPKIPAKPDREYSVIELFAGAGGLAIGLEKAGLKCKLLNEIDSHACHTLKKNRPEWNIVQKDVKDLDFTKYKGKIDVLTGGFPCQAFSYAGLKLGLEDARGTLFFEFARAVKETLPLIAIGENVRGLVAHENGKTLAGMISILNEIGYDVVTPQVLKAIHYRVPQKRERLFLVAIKKNTNISFNYPLPYGEVLTIRDALKAGKLYKKEVPISEGQVYPKRKKEILKMVPPGGYWRDLPIDIQKEYMLKSFYLGGGKTGMARRMSWDEPSLTLTCSPAQKQTERCHPDETRPFTIREYARIQTFPDNWEFCGPVGAQYKQIGNAVPVNLAYAVGLEIVKSLNVHEKNTAKMNLL